MNAIRAIAMLFASSPAIAVAGASFTPVVEVGGRATDNAGDRPEELGPQSSMTANGSAGGRLIVSQPLWSMRLDALTEYEQYLSAPVRNAGATGQLDGRWRPDERTYVRSRGRLSHSPDRWDPEVPYHLAIASAPGDEMPAFIRATTTRWSEKVQVDHRATETWRVRARGGVSATRYGDRHLGDVDAARLDPRVLQSRTVLELGTESLWATRENVEIGLFAEESRADYEVTPDTWNTRAGGVMEWNIFERLSFRARTGPDWTTVPGSSLPDRWGFTADASLIRKWTLVELEVSGREGMFLADASIPAARRTVGRFTVRALPFERISLEAWAGGGLERSLYERYHATGTARTTTAGTTLGWRMTEHLTARAGYQYSSVDATGRVELPYRSNTIFFGLSLSGWNFGTPAPETSF